MKIGYACLSTRNENIQLQLDALADAGCELIYQEQFPEANLELTKLLTHLYLGDTVYVYKLDCLGRSLRHLLVVVADIGQMGVGLISLSDEVSIPPTQSAFVSELFTSLVTYEREMTRTLIQEGLVSARSKGRVGGRPPGLSTEAERTAATAEMLYRTQDLSLAEITQRLCISKNTLYKYLRHRQVPIDTYRKRAA